MLIFIVGYMASGKTTLGKQLAKHYGFDFLDLDTFIESQECMSIKDIFALGGEDLFRKKEHLALKKSLCLSDTIISTGGGAAIYSDNMDLMNDNGSCIFFDVSVDEIVKRVSNSSSVRPLLSGMNYDSLHSFVSEHLNKRMPYYKKAKYKICSDNINVEYIVSYLENLDTAVFGV